MYISRNSGRGVGGGGRCIAPAYIRLLHPFPSVLVTLVSGALACVAVRGWPGGGRLATLMGAMLCIQFAIGVINDWADRRLDAVAKPQKPIPSGAVSARAALMTGVGLIVVGGVLAARAGALAWLLAMTGLTIGLAYDLGLKRTRWSALTYALALPLVPVWVWTAMGERSPALWAALPVGALLGFGLQLANALTDAQSDAASGVRGTLQWIGPARGRWVVVGCIATGIGAAVGLAPLVGVQAMPFGAVAVAASLLVLGAAMAYQRSSAERAAQLAWTLLAPAVGLLAVGWLASLP